MSPETYDELYKAAAEFEDYVLARLSDEWGMTLRKTGTFTDQTAWGDTRVLEIKLDRKFERTGNLCIETHEQPSRPGPGRSRWPMVHSGIQSDAAAFLFGIGNRREFFVFAKRDLVEYWRTSLVRAYKTETSWGFLLPRREASRLALACYLWTDEPT